MVAFRIGKLVELHYIEPGDYIEIRRYYSHPEVRKFLSAPRRLRSLEEARRRVERALRDESMVAFKILSKEFEDRFSGIVSLSRINYPMGRAAIGYRIRKDRRGRGYATEAVRLMLRHAFERLDLYVVYAEVKEPNKASCRVLEKNGFRLVGRIPGYTKAPGYGRVDLLIYAITKEDRLEGRKV